MEYDAYQELANAIIVRAAEDYRTLLRLQRNYPNNSVVEQKIKELEYDIHTPFFQSQEKISLLSGRLIFLLLSMQVLIKRSFLDPCQFRYFTDSVLTGLVEFHRLAKSIAIYGLATALPTTGTSGGQSIPGSVSQYITLKLSQC